MMITPTLDLERSLASQGYDLIVGFDEVGRGALAGPVMVGCAAIWARDLKPDADGELAQADGSAASSRVSGDNGTDAGVITPDPAPYLSVPAGVADSKMLTEHRREAIFDELCSWCAAYAVGQASNAEIDEWGITYALGVAALRALNQVERDLGVGSELGSPREGSCLTATEGKPLPSRRPITIGAILDGPSDYITKALNTFDAPDVPIPADVTTKVKGDQHCATVATAAVIAKVTRDRLMVSIAQGNPRYSAYEWDHNKGYGSAAHRAAIAEYGPTPLHRTSWHLT